MTSAEHGGIIFPVGLGIGATHDTKATISPSRAAGIIPIMTVADPLAIIPGPPGTHEGIMQGFVILVTTAACKLLIITVGTHFRTMSMGTGGCGTGVGTGAAGWIGA